MKLEKAKASFNRVWYGVDERRLDCLIENKEKDSGIIQEGKIFSGDNECIGQKIAFIPIIHPYSYYLKNSRYRRLGTGARIEFYANTDVEEIFKTEQEARDYARARIRLAANTVIAEGITGGKELNRLARTI